MKTIKIWNDSPSERQLDDIAEAVKDGGVIIFPTDTVYGIGCDALNSKAIERICRIKGINPAKTNLSIICSDISMAADYARIDDKVFRMMRNNTPGPFTFILKALSSLPRAFKGRKCVGVRIPDCLTVRMLAEKLGNPLLSTSIEWDDDDYAVSPLLIAEKYENVADMMVEGEEGKTTPSTVIDCTLPTPEITRQGAGELI